MSGSIDYDPDHVFEIDWEARRWDAAVAAMQGILANTGMEQRNAGVAVEAIDYTDALIELYRKTEAK